jgi:hypothetical protein
MVKTLCEVEKILENCASPCLLMTDAPHAMAGSRKSVLGGK